MKPVKKIGTATSTFAIRVTGTKFWIWDRGLSIREIRNGRVEEWADHGAGRLMDGYLLEDAVIELCIGDAKGEDDEQLVLEKGHVKMRAVERCICKGGLSPDYAADVPIVRVVRISSSYDYTETLNDPNGFDSAKLELLISSMVVGGMRKNVLIGCAYRGSRLAYAGGTDYSAAAVVGTAIVCRNKAFPLDKKSGIPVVVGKTPFIVHIRALEDAGEKDGVHYYGGYALSGRGMFGVFECVPDDVLCNGVGDYVCDQLFMKDEPDKVEPFTVHRIDGYNETAYVYNAVLDTVGRR